MKLYYITLNNADEARQIGRALLEQKLAVCVNWFPITCAYIWKGEIHRRARNGFNCENSSWISGTN